MGSLVRGMLLPPVPRRLDPAPPGPVLRRLRMLSAELARLAPDAIILASVRWVTTFHHYVAGPGRLAGVATPVEAAGCGGVRYGYPGDPALARALVAAGTAARIPVALTEEPSVPLDHATVTALAHVVPDGDVPVVPVSLCHLADLAEMLRWGRAIGAAIRAHDRRVVVAVAGAVSGGDGRMRDLLGTAAPDGWDAPRAAPREARVAAGGHPLALLLGAVGSGCGARPPVTPAYQLPEPSLDACRRVLPA